MLTYILNLSIFGKDLSQGDGGFGRCVIQPLYYIHAVL